MKENRVQITIGAENQAGPGVKNAQADLRELGNAAERTGGRTKKSFHEATVSSNSFSGSIQQLRKRVISLQGVLVGLGAGMAIHESLRAFAAMDKGLIGIQKTTNMTDKQMQAMGASIRQLALDVPVATEGLLKIAEAAGQLGVTGVKDVTLFTETLAKMQIASDVVGAEGAKSLARLLNVAGEATEGVKILGSVIVALGNQMAASEAEIVHMASEVGRGTAAFNVSSAAAVAYGAALKAMGARAEISGSAITRSMIEIEKAIIGGGKEFIYLQEVTGMTGETIKQVFQEDSAKVFNAFIRGAHDMTENGESAITILEKFGLKGTEVIKGLTPLIKNVEQLDKAFRIANKEVKNATALDEEAIRASSSFSAQMQLTKNAVDEIAAGIGKGLAPAIVEVTQDFRNWVETNQEFINQEVPEKIDAITEKVKGLIDVYNSIPGWVVGVAGYGILGGIFFGAQGAAVFAAIAASLKAADFLSDKIVDLMHPLKEVELAFVELHTAQGSVWVERGDMDAYQSSLNQIDDATDSLAKNTKGFGDSTEDASNKVKAANKQLEEYYKQLDKAKTAMDRVTLMAMPEYERGLESISRKYEAANDDLDKWGEFHGKTTGEIARLHNDLGLRMDEEINDYVKSHETGTDKIYDTWVHAYERLQDITADWIYNMKVDFDSLVDLFKRTVAQMISAWLWGQQNMQFATAGQGGFSLGGMFGGMFGGYGAGDPRNPNFVGPLQQGVQGASTAYSLSQAYGAYTTAGGGWGGMKAGAGSFFGGGGSGGGGFSLSGISWTTWAAIAYIAESMAAKQNVKHGYGRIEGTPYGYGTYQPGGPWSGDIFNEPLSTYGRGLLGMDAPTATGYQSLAMKEGDFGEWLKASFVAAWDPFGFTESLLGKIGIDLGKIFGYGNKKRSGLGREYTFGDYSSETGWAAPGMEQYWDKRKGVKAFGESAEGMAAVGQNIMNAMDTMFKNLLGYFGDEWANKFTTEMIKLAAADPSFKFQIDAEDKGEFWKDWNKSWQDLTKNLIDPIVETGTALLSQALDSAVTDSTAWNYFTDEMRDYLKISLEDSLGDLKIDWTTVTDQASLEAALEQMGLAVEQIASIIEYFDTVGDILDYITTTIDMHGYSDSIKSAMAELGGINAEFQDLANTLVSLGVDLEKYTDLQKAYDLAIIDWINKAFVGAISYASTSQGWQAMAPQSMSSTQAYIDQYQHVQNLAGAYDGTTASAIELSDALGILSGLSYDLAAEIQSAINSIRQSYGDVIEGMRLDVMTDQQKYDYYRQKVSDLYTLLPTLTDPGAIRQVMDDILKYSGLAWGMLSEDQQKQFVGAFTGFLTDVETEGIARLEAIGGALDEANNSLIDELRPLLTDAVTEIKNAAILIKSGGEDVKEGGADILDAAGIPITVDVNVDSGEVG